MLLATVALSQMPPPSFGIAAPPTFLQLDAAPGYDDGRTPLTARDRRTPDDGRLAGLPQGGRHRHRRDGASHQRTPPGGAAAPPDAPSCHAGARARPNASRRRRRRARARTTSSGAAAPILPEAPAPAQAATPPQENLFPKLKVPPALVNGMNPAFASMLAKPGGFHSRQVTGARRRQLALQPAQNYRL